MSSLVPSASYIHPLPVCNWPRLTDTCPVLTYSISGARVPLGQTVTPDSAKWQSNAAHRANHWNLLALLQLPRLEPLKNRVCAQKERCAMMWFIWMDEEAAGCKDERVCVCVRIKVGVKCQQGSARFTGSSWWMSLFLALSPVPSILRTLDKQVLPGCDELGNPTRCIWISHTCPVASAEGHGRLNEAARGDGDEETARASRGTAGRWCFISSSVFISQVVKFIYQLSILCFVSLLYPQYKVTINSIWESRDRLSSSSASYFPSSSAPDALKFCDNLYKTQK